MSRIDPHMDVTVAPTQRTRVRRWAMMLSLPFLIAAVGIYFWLTGGRYVATDNATVGAHVVSVAPEVSGRIVEVAVQENQQVKAGQLLFRIDPAPYRIALMQADATVGNARLQVAELQGGYGAKVAITKEDRVGVVLAEQTFRRQEELIQRGFTTRASFDAAQSALSTARAKVVTSMAEADTARALLGASAAGGHPRVEAAVAQREKAELDLSRTEVRAPNSGRVAQTSRLEIGGMALASVPTVSVVGSQAPWIEANFKETQLAKIRTGQRAEVTIDAVPGRTFAATVSGIGSGTGSEFSVLPAQNATGNWVKVTQRVPVRLRLDELPDRPLVAGWSAHVRVRVAD